MSPEAVVVQLDLVEHAPGVYYLTCQSPFGETNFRLDLPEPEARRLQTVETNVLRSGAQLITRGSAGRLEAPIRQLGTDLCDAVLHDESRELFEISLRHAEATRTPFQLMLRIRGNTLAQLPWEFLYDRRRGDYLALNLPVVRYLDVMQPVAPVTVKLPLRILGVISHPDDRDQLQVAAEKEALSAALAPLGDSHVRLNWLEGSGWEHLWRAARGASWHILHFIGHGGFDEARGEGYLEFVDDDGGARHVYATDLGRLLHDNGSLRLAVLNACESGRASGVDTFASPAASFIRRGFPAAVAMQYEISDPAALIFAQALYAAIASGVSLDRAVTDARTTVHMTQPGSLEWGTPVLYLRSRNADVFEVEGASPPPVPPGSVTVTDPHMSATGIDSLRRANDLVRTLAAQPPPRQVVGTATVPPAKPPQAKPPQAKPPQAERAQAERAQAAPPPEKAPEKPRPTGYGFQETHRFTHPGPVHAVAVDPAHRRIFAAGEHGEILCWDLDRAQVCRCCRLPDRPAPVRSIAVTRDGRFVAAVHDDRLVRVWDVETETATLNFRTPGNQAGHSVRFSPDESLLVVGCSGGLAQVTDRYGRERLRLVHRPEVDNGGRMRPPGDVHAATFSPDGRWIATGADDGLLRLFGANGQIAARFPHPHAVLDVAFRSDGRILATGTADGVGRLWNARGEVQGRFNHGSAVGAVAFIADGRLVTAGADGIARLWHDDDRPHAWTDVGGAIAAMAGRAEKSLVTAHADHTVRVWERA
ncbi:CHAT domain-containing protein [Actinoplanes sp. NPDC051513]|uniref:CHAT domain-containing protein n=1 Tax=Actinoplanes sp. NPDC051513 TaxID=3363908 RepID=UPI0037BD55DC